MIYGKFCRSFCLNILRKKLDPIKIELFDSKLIAKYDNQQISVTVDLVGMFDYIDSQRLIGIDVSDFMFDTLANLIKKQIET